MDDTMLVRIAEHGAPVITVEDGIMASGFGEAVQAAWLVPVLPAAADQSHHHIEALVQVEQGKQNHHSKIEMLDKFQHSHSCNPP